jgi:flagellum-specific peptidoglycan hydrolase FlgJ
MKVNLQIEKGILSSVFNLGSKSVKAFLTIIIILFLSVAAQKGPENENVKIEKYGDKTFMVSDNYAETVKQRAEDQLIHEVDSFIKKTAPKCKLSSEFLVKKCLEYDIDISFVIAQGILESHLGTKGLATTTNSVWNVGTFDDGQIKYTYKTANESLEPYLILLKEKYLIRLTAKGDTISRNIYHLTKDKGYVNLHGKRYATAVGYEAALRKTLISVNLQTSISMYQSVIKLSDDRILAYFAPEVKDPS